jgi:ubiquinone/menaquinone biosynthesis C-methylase UbiE
MVEINRQEVIMPGGIELTLEAERHLDLHSDTRLLSVACGTGELELYLAEKYGCAVTGIDIGEWAIKRAREKVAARGLGHLARFEIGDGNALRFATEAFDVVLCCGALCAFFDNGLKEFHRVLAPGGRAAIMDVLWRRDPVPEHVAQCWAGEGATVLTRDGNCRAFEERGFRVRFAQAYHEPAWWKAYYDDREDAPHWREERANYEAHRDYIGLGVFILEKSV